MTARELHRKLIDICANMTQGDYEQAKGIFELLPCDDPRDSINVLVEAFAMMLVRTEAQEFELSRLLAELDGTRSELLRHKEQFLEENSQLRVQLRRKTSSSEKFMYLTQAPTMVPVMHQAKRAASVDCTVLLSGETGTGKSLLARHIHNQSPRAGKPFVVINCAAIPATLLESELFGIDVGVASGVKERMGRFEQASGGTIFLDEIGEMPFESQAKLLHVVESGVVERIGGRKPIQIDVRIMAATLRDLEQCVKERTFREDLYYRLNVMQIHIPPLRERQEDIPLLVKHMLRRYAERNPRAVTAISREALSLMQEHPWPGNVRELENELERASLLAEGVSISPDDLSPNVGKWGEDEFLAVNSKYSPSNQPIDDVLPLSVFAPSATTASLGGVQAGALDVEHISTLEELEKIYITNVLNALQGNKSRAARALGISREGLRVRLKRIHS